MWELLKTFVRSEMSYLTLVVGGVFLAVGTATAWAVRSRRHWFVRTAVVGAALWPALVLFGYHMVMILLIQAAVGASLMTVMKLGQRRSDKGTDEKEKGEPRRRWIRFRFTLADLLLMTLVIAVVLGVAVGTPASIRAEFKDTYVSSLGILGFWFGWLSVGFPGMLFLAGRKSRSGSKSADWLHRMKRTKIGRIVWLAASALWVLFVLLLCLLFVFSWAFVAMFHLTVHQTPPPPITLPQPNGYDDLIWAASQLPDSVPRPDFQEVNLVELEKFVGKHRHVLEAARRGLARPCQVPLTYTWEDTHRSDVGTLCELGRALLAEGKLAELQGRTESAVDSYLDVMRLGAASARGGVADHAFMEWILLRWSAEALASLRGRLTADQCRKAIEVARSIEASRERTEDVLARHALWVECFRGKALRIFDSQETWRSEVEQQGQWNQIRMRLLICELAVEQYRLEQGSEPSTLADLVPGYLTAVPTDPFSGKSLRYRRTSSGHLLYSVGPDGVDDQGKPMERWDTSIVCPGDVLLNEPKELYLGEL